MVMLFLLDSNPREPLLLNTSFEKKENLYSFRTVKYSLYCVYMTSFAKNGHDSIKTVQFQIYGKGIKAKEKKMLSAWSTPISIIGALESGIKKNSFK